MDEYLQFLRNKIELAPESGFQVDKSILHPALKPHQRDAVAWALQGGRRALFESFGLGKTVQELEWCRQVVRHEGGKALIVLPLGVRQEFQRDAAQLLEMDVPPYIRTMDEAEHTLGDILMTNYERVRDGDIDPAKFTAAALDEASVLRSFGSKTYQTFLDKFKGVRYKLVSTATPSPNRYKELIHYAGYLEVMDTGQALTRFFQRDSTKANNLKLYPHREDEFWLWVSSWALVITRPSDLGYPDEGYALPPLQIKTHVVRPAYNTAVDRDGQVKMENDVAMSLQEAAREKRESIQERVAIARQIVDGDPDAHFILWHDLEAERKEIMRVFPEASEIHGTMDYAERERRVIDFSDGKTRLFATKKELSGSGCNFQRHCHRAIFIGIDYEFNDFIQAIHRIYRFLQTEPVVIDIIYTEAEDVIYRALMEKWEQHNFLQNKMREIVRKYGLGGVRGAEQKARTIGCERVEVKGKNFTAVNNDCVEELRGMEAASVGLIVTSIPFSNHYEYTPSYNDFGHNPDTEAFFRQMDYLTPELLRVLEPGRVFCCHVKDRVLFGNATGTGMPTIEPFHALCIEHYMRHGFQYFGMITVVTDVVRENNQTYRLGWSEQCKDGSKMGVGCPEYVLLFRKLPTDHSKAYADHRIEKSKEEYTRAQWQIDAHGFWRSSGDRLLTKKELLEMDTGKLQAAYRKYSRDSIYDYSEHVRLAKELDADGRLPATFMVVAPGSWTDEVWDDINRMRTLNTRQSQRRKQMHVCLARGSLILTRRGFIPIQDVLVGDMVLTHKGNWKPVLAKACTGVKETIQTKATGVPCLVTTPDHKMWARMSRYVRKKDGMRIADPDWVEAKVLPNGGYVNLKLPEVEISELTQQEWWLVGRYLADGHMGTRGDFFISVGREKKAEFEMAAGDMAGAYSERDALQYRLKNLREPMKEMLRKCGRGAANKQIPVEGLCLSKVFAECMLSGYLSGDGNVAGNCTTVSSASRSLLLGMAMVAQRARGVVASIYAGRPERDATIQGREVHCSQEWIMTWRTSDHHHESEILEDGAWKKVRQFEPKGKQEVWSIQVEDDASYTAEGCIVKNCPLQLDIVDRLINRYSNPGDLVLDPFGGLGTVALEAVKAGRRGYTVELNNDYFRDAVGYLKEYEDSQQEETISLFDFLDSMEMNKRRTG